MKFLLLLAAFSAQAKQGSCKDAVPDETGMKYFRSCLSKLSQPSLFPLGAFADVDKGLLFIVDTKSDEPGFKCYEIVVGARSQGDPADIGQKRKQTPGGLTFTARHDGKKYRTDHKKPAKDAVGLIPADTKNSQTKDRGVIIHPSTFRTSDGCLGVKNGKFPEIKKALGVTTQAPVFMWGKEMLKDGRNWCDGNGGKTPMLQQLAHAQETAK